MATAQEPPGSRFLELPGEIRESIYHQVLCSTFNEEDLGDDHKRYVFDLSLFRTSKQIYYEARAVFRRTNIFVVIETPWPEAKSHVNADGHVPILAENDLADSFASHHLTVTLDAPEYASINAQAHRFVVLVDDLPKFAQMWAYSDLTHPGLNNHLRLTLKLAYPFDTGLDNSSPIPKAVQRRLLEPFGQIKGLLDVQLQGEHYASVEKAMRDAMAVPYMAPEACLELGTRLKDEGNAALKAGRYADALRLYVEAFRAIHIVCSGRLRHVWGDAFFMGVLRGGAFDKQEASIVRLQLRVRLVANTVLAYLKLEQWRDAHFWGLRTVNMFRGGVHAEFMPDFIAAPELGKVYYRTALAARELGDEADARALLRVAVQYLPRDEIVKKELAAVALKLG